MKFLSIICAILLITLALFTQGVIKSLAELSAFLLVVYYLYLRKSQPSKRQS